MSLKPYCRLATILAFFVTALSLPVPGAFADDPKPVSDAVTTDCSWAEEPEIASGPHGFLVVFGGWAMRLDSLGNRLDDRRFALNGNPMKVVWFNGRYVAIGGFGKGSFVSDGGFVTPLELPLAMSGLHALVVNGDRLLMVYWRDPSSVRLAILDSSLNVLADSLIESVDSWWKIASVAATATQQGFLVAYTRVDCGSATWGCTYSTLTRHVEGTNVSAADLIAQNISRDIALSWDGKRALLVFAGSATNAAAMTHVFLDENGALVSQPTVTPGRVWSPRLTWTGAAFLMAYVTEVDAGDVAAVRIDPDTGAVGPPMPVVVDDPEQLECSIATGTDSIVIVWNTWWGWAGVKSVAWDRQYVPRQDPQILSRAYASQRDPVAASVDGTHLVVWTESRCAGLIVAGRIAEDGEALDGSGVILADRGAIAPKVVVANDLFIVYWLEQRADSTYWSVLQPITKEMVLLPRIEAPFLVDRIIDNPSRNESLLLSRGKGREGDRYYSVLVKRLLADGTFVDAATVSVADRNPVSVDIAASDDGFLLVFDDPLGGCQITCPPEYYAYVSRVYAQRLDQQGNAVGSVTVLDDYARDPRVRWTGTDFLVTWTSPSPVTRVFIRGNGTVSLTPSEGAQPYIENIVSGFKPSLVETLTDGVVTMIARARLEDIWTEYGYLDPYSRLLTMRDGSLRVVYVTDVPPTTGSSRIYSRAISDVENDISIHFLNLPSFVDSPSWIDVPVVITNKGASVATFVYVTAFDDSYSSIPLSNAEWAGVLQPGESETLTGRFHAGYGLTSISASAVAAERDLVPRDNFVSHDVIVPPCGDANGDGFTNGADVFYLVNYLLAGAGAPVRKDANGDGVTTMADVFYLVNYVFATGRAPVCP